MVIREFYFSFRATIKGVEAVGLVKMLINEQTLSNLMGRLLATDRKQWVVDKSMWIQGEVEIVCVEQKREDAKYIWGSLRISWLVSQCAKK